MKNILHFSLTSVTACIKMTSNAKNVTVMTALKRHRNEKEPYRKYTKTVLTSDEKKRHYDHLIKRYLLAPKMSIESSFQRMLTSAPLPPTEAVAATKIFLTDIAITLRAEGTHQSHRGHTSITLFCMNTNCRMYHQFNTIHCND